MSEGPCARTPESICCGVHKTSSLRRPASFSETNEDSVAILLAYSPARVLLAGDAEAKEEKENMASDPYTRP